MTAQVEQDGPRYPGVVVELSGSDGNAFSILGKVQKALKRAGVEPSVVDDYWREATAGDYDQLLQVTMRWVVVL